MSTEALEASWRAQLALDFARAGNRTVLAQRASDGPLVVQKPLYPEGEEVCHAIVVHPPGGIAGGDELSLKVKSEGHALLTTPGAAKWYRSAGRWAKQTLVFDVQDTLEWLPRETIVFDGALAELKTNIQLGVRARFIGWEVVCLGRTGSGERLSSAKLRLDTRILRAQKPLWVERGEIAGGGALLSSPVGLHGHSVYGTFVATDVLPDALALCREIVREATLLPGLLIARYLGDSTEQAMHRFTALWKILRPAVVQRAAQEPRIWRT